MKQLHVKAWEHSLPENTLTRAHPGDAGLDICAIQDTRIDGYGVTLVPTGLSVIIPEGCFGMLTLRSGWSTKNAVIMPNAPGIIDCSFRGEIQVPIFSLVNTMGFTLKAGVRFAQLIILPYENVAVTFHSEPSMWPVSLPCVGDRGTGGFGDSGE